ncbi:peptidoglycan-binding protein [Candidatus Uhrbacteria bacterium]|nr:peptidoglycan-binding protein [Candidatus Uhrbacteria bacterium]
MAFVVLVVVTSALFMATVFAATTITVCNSGCDYTTITDAINLGAPASGDTIAVGADYASTTETFPFNLPTGVNLDCQNSGAVIGVDDENNRVNIHPQSDNIFRDCQYSNVSIESNGQSNIQILDNGFFENSRISTNNVTDITATGNTGLKNINIGNTVGATIDSNTINSLSYASGDALQITNSTSVQFTRNIITDYVTSTPTGDQIIGITNHSYDIYFASNTVSMPSSTYSGGGLSVLEITSSLRITVRDNVFSMSGNGGGIQVLNLNGSGGDIEVDTQHNTIKMNDPCNNCSGILMSSWNVSTVTVTSSYNLIVATTPSSTASMSGHSSYGAGPSSSLHLFTEYEGFVGLNVLDTTDFPKAGNSIVRNDTPFRVDDATSTDDNELVSYSVFLDVNGAEDVGAIPGARGNDFHVVEGGTIDYSAVDATNTTTIIANLRSGDTVNLAAGTYSPVFLVATTTNVAVVSGVSFLGAGSSTIIHASSTGNALYVDGMTDSIFRDFTVTGASSTATSTYKITRSQFSAGGTDYDDGSGIGFPNAVIIAGGVPFGGSCNASLYDADDYNVTTIVGGATDDWNVFLIDYFGNKLTLIGPDRFIPDATAAAGCGGPGLVTIEHEVSSVYTVSSGVYTYNAAAAALAGVSPKTGETNPPRLDMTIVGATEAGIALNDSSDNIFTNVTSTGNSVGVSFTGTSTNNLFTDAAMDSNDQYDIRHETAGDQTFADSLFDITQVSITGNGLIQGKFSARVFTQNSSLVGVSGVTVNGVSANSASSTSLVSAGSGFSSYSTPLPAFSFSSSSATLTTGGFNPYTWTSIANSSFNAASVSASLSQPRQTITLTLTAAPSTGGGGGGGGGSVIYPPVTPPVDDGLAARLAVFAQAGLSPGDLVKLPDDGNALTQYDSTVYELDADGRRHAFPNPSVYFSRHCSFANVRIVNGVLARIPLGINMTYFPGLRLVKFISVPTVYLVQAPNALRAIPNEAAAVQLVGADWSKRVSDISDAFYNDYVIALPITSAQETLDRTPPLACSVTVQPWPFLRIPQSFSFSAALTYGARNAEVLYLQEVLAFLGPSIYPEAVVNGVYGDATTDAVKRFQSSKGLKQTGAVGPGTRAELNATLDIYR